LEPELRCHCERACERVDGNRVTDGVRTGEKVGIGGGPADRAHAVVGAAGVSAVPDSARVVQMMGQREDPNNYLLMHAMAPNVAGVIGSAVGAGVLWSVLVG